MSDGIQPRRLHPAYLLISAGRTARGLLPFIAVGLWKIPGWTLMVAAVIVAVFAFTSWWLRRYSLTDGVLRERSGVFNRTERVIPARRVTSLSAERGMTQRLLRVWRLRIITPGGSADLPCLSVGELRRLRTALDPADRTGLVPQPAGSEPPPTALAPPFPGPHRTSALIDRWDGESSSSPPLAVLDTRTLLLAAVTGTSVPLVFAGAAAVYGRSRDLLPQRYIDTVTREALGHGYRSLLVVAALLLVAVAVGVVLTAIRLARFTLRREGDQLRITRGLIGQRSATITVDRVQGVRIVEGALRRSLGYCSLELEVAGLRHGENGARTLFPMLPRHRAPELIARSLPELGWIPGPLTPVPAASLRRYLTMPILLAVPVTAAVVALPGGWATLAVLPVPLAALIGAAQARTAAFRLDESTVVIRSRRVLVRSTLIARRRRVQLTSVSATWAARRARVASVRVRLSSGRRARVRYLPEAVADELLRRVGRRVPPAAVAGRALQPCAARTRQPQVTDAS